MTRRRGLTLLVLVALATTTAAAQSGRYIDPASGWPELLDPERRQARRYMRMGLALLVEAMEPRDPVFEDRQDVMLDRALLRFERAHRITPDDPELNYYIAYALTRWRRPTPDGDVQDRADEAMDQWHRLRALDGDFMPERVAYELAMLHMRRHEFGQARAEYEEALRVLTPQPVILMGWLYLPTEQEGVLYGLFSPLDEANVRANLAEVAMLVGDVRAAIPHYEAAIERAPGPITRSLAQWGRALALDRAGDHDAAIEATSRAIREDPLPGDPRYGHLSRRYGPFAVLHLPSVFFEPIYEIHAYEALGHEARAGLPDADFSPREERLRALRSWRLFLNEGGTTSRFAPVARAHVDRLEAATAEPRGR